MFQILLYLLFIIKQKLKATSLDLFENIKVFTAKYNLYNKDILTIYNNDITVIIIYNKAIIIKFN